MLYRIILLQGLLWTGVVSLTCWTCDNASNEQECAALGSWMKCRNEQDVCSTVKRRFFGKTSIWKSCKQEQACYNDRKQNREGNGLTCNDQGVISVCHCCCEGHLCNKEESCGSTSGLGCASWTTKSSAHDQVKCSDSNKLGSKCEFSCKEDEYSLNPSNVSEATCLRNGKWSSKKPCCTRPCPPFLPADVIVLAHKRHEKNLAKRRNLMVQNMIDTILWDSDNVRFSVLFYSGTIHFDISFFDGHEAVNDDTVTFRRTDDSLVNTGGAMEFVEKKKLFHGDRRNHIDMVLVITESNTDDDVAQISRRLREKGTLIFAIFLNFDNVVVDKKKLLEMTGDENQIFIFDEESLKKNAKGLVHLMWKRACNFICEKL